MNPRNGTRVLSNALPFPSEHMKRTESSRRDNHRRDAIEQKCEGADFVD